MESGGKDSESQRTLVMKSSIQNQEGVKGRKGGGELASAGQREDQAEKE